MDVQGKVVLVTGASSGIGMAAARALALRGALVALAARNETVLERLEDELPGSLAVPADMRREADVRRMVHAVHAHYGGLDVLVNNAGRAMHGPLMSADLAEYRDLLALNVVGPLQAMQLAVPIMRAQGGGVIVNVSSGTTLHTLPGVGAYSSSKHALNNLSKVARVELAGDNIRVCLVYPYVTATNFAGGHTYRPGLVADTADYAASLVCSAIESERAETFAAKTGGWRHGGPISPDD